MLIRHNPDANIYIFIMNTEESRIVPPHKVLVHSGTLFFVGFFVFGRTRVHQSYGHRRILNGEREVMSGQNGGGAQV